MNSPKKFIVSHAPFWHNGSTVAERNFNALFAALPAALVGIAYFGVPALGVVCLAIASAVGWEWAFTRVAKLPDTVGDGHAALTGLIFAMLLPATAPWWLVITGTLVAIVVGKQIFGGIGSHPFHPAVLSYAILTISWAPYFDFDGQLLNMTFSFPALYPLGALKAFGPEAIADLSLTDLFLGQQIGGLGSTCGLALVLGGLYLVARGYARWEIPLAFIVGLFITATLFHVANPAKYAGPLFHLLTGYSLLAAFFLLTDDSSSPVNLPALLIYGAAGGMMTILIRNIGAYQEGVIYAILVVNLINPLIDKIRPKAIGKAA